MSPEYFGDTRVYSIDKAGEPDSFEEYFPVNSSLYVRKLNLSERIKLCAPGQAFALFYPDGEIIYTNAVKGELYKILAEEDLPIYEVQ